MLLNSWTLIAQAITNVGGVSADYTIHIVVGACAAMVSIIFGFLLSSINSIKMDVKEIRKDFHNFVEEQKGLNASFHERTKNL